jgi:hypothetical protein
MTASNATSTASAKTASANDMSARLSKSLRRTITAKAVRTWARDNIARFDKAAHAEYQTHDYNAAEQRAIVDGFAKRAQRSNAQRRATAKAAPKSTPRKRTAKAASAPTTPDATN